MKATGIVRRIDDLGRVVIPKEIRRTLRLREGTPLEIFTDREGEIILKKYSPMVELAAFAGQYAEAMSQATGLIVCITDRDQVIAVSGGARKELLQKAISQSLERVINERQTIQAGKDDKSFVRLIDEELEGITAQVVAPIICEGDAWRSSHYEPGAKSTVWRNGAEAGCHCLRIFRAADGKLKQSGMDKQYEQK